MRSVSESFNTNGVGYWSDEAREVRVVGMEVNGIDDEGFAELRVYFDTKTWDISEHGLIYTDRGFLAELIEYLTRAGYDASDVSYSEQGMQGDNYVSLDVGSKFTVSWSSK